MEESRNIMFFVEKRSKCRSTRTSKVKRGKNKLQVPSEKKKKKRKHKKRNTLQILMELEKKEKKKDASEIGERGRTCRVLILKGAGQNNPQNGNEC